MSIRTRLTRAFERVFKGPDELELTEGTVGRPLFFLSLPIVITNLLQTAYNLADTFWLGQYSTEALAAISFAFPMVFLLIALGMGLSVAGSILVAQYTGADRPQQAEYAASQTMTFSLLAAVILGLLGFFVVHRLLGLFGASPDVLPGATAYMQVISLGLVFMFGFFVFISLMRGYGDTVTPMLVMFGSVAVNIALDPFVIFGWGPFPELGVAGAAYATIFSRGLALVVGLYIMFEGSRGVRIRPREMIPDVTFLRRLLRLGVPASIEGTGRALSVNLMLFVVGMFPTTVVAAYGIGVRVFSVVFLPAIAVARGVETMTGQNIGADKPDRAATAAGFAAKVMFVILGLFGVYIWIAGEAVVGLFSNDPTVVATGTTFLQFVAPTFGFLGIMRAYSGSIRGAGKTMVAAVIGITTLGLIRLPIAYVGAINIGQTGIWIAFGISNVVGAVIAYLWYRRGTWREADATTDPNIDLDLDLDDDPPAEPIDGDAEGMASTDDRAET
ncbi:MAG: MATE family efflux transporter [Halobacteriales archaeon]